MLPTIILVAVILTALYALYVNGYLWISSKSALVFIGSSSFTKRNRVSATVKKCSGYVKRIVRLKEQREYVFVFDSQITKGSVTAEILSEDKQALLTLDETNPSGVIVSNGKSRYRLVLRFSNADGKYELFWS